MSDEFESSSATSSVCGRYRYSLSRSWPDIGDSGGEAFFVMLNPSTADAQHEDPTIRRCVNFAKAWGCRSMVVGNLYGLRATDPQEMLAAEDRVGRDNDHYLGELMEKHDDIVCAWGTNAEPERVRQFVEFAESRGAKLWCLGTTKDGAPRHPLYVAQDTEPVRWSLPT